MTELTGKAPLRGAPISFFMYTRSEDPREQQVLELALRAHERSLNFQPFASHSLNTVTCKN